jgi:hypothetical protein
MDDVWSPSEVSLYNTRFPIFGNVRRTNITPFPPKMTIGDYRRDDTDCLPHWPLRHVQSRRLCRAEEQSDSLVI